MVRRPLVLLVLCLIPLASALVRADEGTTWDGLIPGVEADDAGGMTWTTWTMGSDQQAELRVGASKDNGELALALVYRDPADIGGDDGFGVRGYALYSVVDADMIATWLGKETPLPPGELYLGAYGGVEFEDAETEGGFLVGGMLGTIRVEYQFALDRGVLPDDHMLMVGGRWEW